MAMGSTAAGGLFKSLSPRLAYSQPTSPRRGWGVAASTAALGSSRFRMVPVLFLALPPFDWLKKQLFEKPEPEQ
ncbi:uncharacterized protein A4U43_C05F5630 [Asparagus officinalis]|uniref:Uncharacterized protein n=1 Tax=Asparagus officinalis TaxID=4686 RepID=A0A5P1ETB0_ASPOF|nr:uncharacterized protein A4U43_C05F5630 [Asparagus officinalis]